ncbi:hypothetical protein F383_18666 [Gossypium arboreum]|uniref:Uncharacterized protein n=1 Tax=Gossypium arboreum TaxID=29729 RepID=A0A0B0NM81_GOSAR|nr:hypothetical protein F383_18666 [Gossypium arboreum]
MLLLNSKPTVRMFSPNNMASLEIEVEICSLPS